MFAEPLYIAILLRTLRVSAMVAILSLLLGYPVAYYMTRCRGWAFALMTAAVLLPLCQQVSWQEAPNERSTP